MSGALAWRPEPDDAVTTTVKAWLQDSLVARSGEEAALRLIQFEGALAPPRVPGYSPFDDPAKLAGYHLPRFRGSGSPEETAFIMQLEDRYRQRARELEDAGMSRFVAGMLSPENLATLPVPLLAGGSTALGVTARAAALGGAVAGGTALAQGLGDQVALPPDIRSPLLESTMLSTLFGAVLGGALGGVVSKASLDRAAARSAAVHGAYEGRTGAPGGKVPDGPPRPVATPRDGVAPAEPPPVASALGAAARAPGEAVEAPSVRLTDEEIAAHVDRHRPLPMEQFIDGEWVTLKAQGWDDARTRDAALREEAWDDMFAAGLSREMEADLDVVLGPRERLVAANDAPDALAEVEMRLDALQRLTDRMRAEPTPANDNTILARRQVLAMFDEWMAELRLEAANLNLSRNPRPTGGEPGVWWDRLRGTYDDGEARPAVNENDPRSPVRGGDDLTIPPAPPAAPREATPSTPPPSGGDRLAPGALLDRMRWSQFPYYRMKANRIAGVLGDSIARLADEILPIPGLRNIGNAEGYATETRSVVAMADSTTLVRLMFALEETDKAYFAYRGWGEEKAGPFTGRLVGLGQEIRRVTGTQGNAMSMADFSAAAMRLAEDPSLPNMDPAVQRAAKAWREGLFDPLEKAAAEAGVILSVRYPNESLAAIRRERAKAGAVLDRAKAMGAKDVQGAARQWLTMLDGKEQTLAELMASDKPARFYVPHVWMQREVRRGRDLPLDHADNPVRIIADHWANDPDDYVRSWAAPDIRAEIALSHVIKGGAADALERTILRHLTGQGVDEAIARARAATLAAPTRALETNRPGNLRFEINSMLNRPTPGPDVETVRAAVRAALDEAGVPIKAPQDPDAVPKLIEEIAPDHEADRMLDLALPGHARERTIDVPLEKLQAYLNLDLYSVGQEYAIRMGRAIAMSQKFGDPSMQGRLLGLELDLLEAGDGVAPRAELYQALSDLATMRDLALLRYNAPDTADAWSVRTIRFLQNHAIVTQMGKGLFAAMPDIGRVQMEHGFRPMFEAAQQMATNDKWKLAASEAKLAGAAAELALLPGARAMFDIGTIGAERSWPERMGAKLTETMMFVNLLAPWTQKAQEFAGVLTQHFIVDTALKMAAGKASKEEIARMAAYGFDAAKAERIADAYAGAGRQTMGTLRIANTEAWGDRALVEEFRAALKTAVDSQIIRPGLADTPLFMSAPLAQGLLLYKRFGISATQRLLAAGLQRRDAQVVAGMLSAVAIAFFFADPPAGDRDKNPIFNAQRLATAIEKSGVLGIFTDVNNAMELLSGQNVGVRPLLGLDPPLYAKRGSWADQLGAALGPAVNPWLTLTWALTDPEAKADERAGAIRRMIWFNNLIWFDPISRALSREAGSLMHTPTERAPAPGPLVR